MQQWKINSLPNDQLWKYAKIIYRLLRLYLEYVYIYTYDITINNENGQWVWKRARKSIWEGMEGVDDKGIM